MLDMVGYVCCFCLLEKYLANTKDKAVTLSYIVATRYDVMPILEMG